MAFRVDLRAPLAHSVRRAATLRQTPRHHRAARSVSRVTPLRHRRINAGAPASARRWRGGGRKQTAKRHCAARTRRRAVALARTAAPRAASAHNAWWACVLHGSHQKNAWAVQRQSVWRKYRARVELLFAARFPHFVCLCAHVYSSAHLRLCTAASFSFCCAVGGNVVRRNGNGNRRRSFAIVVVWT